MLTQTSGPSVQTMLEGAKTFLQTAKSPQGPFNPAGPWKQTFAIWSHHVHAQMGLFTLQKHPPSDGAFDLQVNWQLTQHTQDVQHIRATLNCSANDLATPRSWHMESMTELSTGSPIRDLTLKEDATVHHGVIELSSGRRRFTRQPLQNWTCNWSLLEAVQRLSGQEIKPLNFTVLDYLANRKDGQTLSYMGNQQVTLMDHPCQLHGYQQVGYGFLPWEYWLDDQHRLIAACTSIYGYLAIEKASIDL